jgi:hypothetical protein
MKIQKKFNNFTEKIFDWCFRRSRWRDDSCKNFKKIMKFISSKFQLFNFKYSFAGFHTKLALELIIYSILGTSYYHPLPIDGM